MELLNFFNTQLYGNKLDSTKTFSNTRNLTANDVTSIDKYAPAIEGLRGGGGIFARKETENPTHINTYKCCMHDNNAGSKAFSARNGPGHLALFQYNIIWTSIEDTIQDLSTKSKDSSELSTNPIAYVWDDIDKKPEHYKFGVTSDSTESCSFSVASFAKEIDYLAAKTSNTDLGETSKVLDPTSYTYVATPITKLPYKTTYIDIPKANLVQVKLENQPNLRSVARTYTATILPIRTLPPPNPNWRTPVRFDPNYNGKTTITKISTYTFINSFTTTFREKLTFINGEYKTIVYQTEIETETIIEIVIDVNEPLIVKPESSSPQKKNPNLFIYIGVGIGVLVLLIIIILVIFLVKKRKEDPTDEDEHEMAAEVVLSLSRTSNTTMVTTDNPFWATTALSDTDDPFKKDFEEEKTADYYKIIHSKKL